MYDKIHYNIKKKKEVGHKISSKFPNNQCKEIDIMSQQNSLSIK